MNSCPVKAYQGVRVEIRRSVEQINLLSEQTVSVWQLTCDGTLIFVSVGQAVSPIKSENPDVYGTKDFEFSKSASVQQDSRAPIVVVSSKEESSLAKEFYSLVEIWKKETFAVSSLTKIYAHPSYQRIMAMGTQGLPLVLKELQRGQGRWFYALKFMAGKNISEGIDNFEDARAAWLEWGYKNNFI